MLLVNIRDAAGLYHATNMNFDRQLGTVHKYPFVCPATLRTVINFCSEHDNHFDTWGWNKTADQ
jgi:hypothetical protein